MTTRFIVGWCKCIFKILDDSDSAFPLPVVIIPDFSFGYYFLAPSHTSVIEKLRREGEDMVKREYSPNQEHLFFY